MKLSFTLYMVTMISKTEESVIHTERTTQKATQGHTVGLVSTTRLSGVLKII